MRRKGIVLIVLVMLVAGAAVVYAHWTDTLDVNANVNTGSIQIHWKDVSTNDDGVNDGWDGEQVLSTVFTFGDPTSNDPAGPYPPADTVTRVLSSPLNYSSTGWGGWSCPPGTTAIAGGVHSPEGATVGPSGVFAPGVTIAGYTWPTTPFGYVYSEGETGFILQNAGTPAPIVLYVDCAGPGTLERYDKDVADCEASIEEGDLFVLNALNTYPSYYCTARSTFGNQGSVPVMLQRIEMQVFLNDEDVTDELESFEGGVILFDDITWDTTQGFWCGTQVDPGVEYWKETINFFHVLNGAEQDANYRVEQRLTFVNWNEYVDDGICMYIAGTDTPIPAIP